MLTGIRRLSGNDLWTIENEKIQNFGDYDNAVSAAGYGLFNVLMLLAALPVGWTCVLDTTVTAFVVQSVECDFELTLIRRGIAVGIVYIGMIIVGPLWDFILQDCIIGYYGKRNVMIVGLVLDTIVNIFCAHATSYYTFVFFKFLNGMIIAGPLSVLMSYLSEFHAPAYQPMFTKWAGLLFAIANIFPPGISSVLILNTSWLNFTIFNRIYETWRIFILLSTIPSIIGIMSVCLMPKSPKFLLKQGHDYDALRLLKTMYWLNNFESKSKFKFTKLIAQKTTRSKSVCKDKLQDSVKKLRTLFSKTHLKTFIILGILQFTSAMGFNTMRLWVPQLFVIMNNFEVMIRSYYPGNETITMCERLFPRVQRINYTSCDYILPDVESAVYANATIIGLSAVTFSFVLTLIANTNSKKIIVMSLSFLVSTVGSFGANWALEIPYILVSCSFIIVASRIAGNIVTAYTSEVTPQTLRPVAIDSINFIGNVGAAVGVVAFSTVLGFNCLVGVMGIGVFTLLSHVMSFFLIERTVKNDNVTVER